MPATVTAAFKARDSGVVSCPPFAEVPQLHLYFCLQLKTPSTVYGVTWITSVSQVFLYRQSLCEVQEP